jgi:Prolyl-tRNA synthetase, C-terminal
VLEWKDFVPALNKNDIVLTPFCNEDEWEEKVKAMSRDEALNGLNEVTLTVLYNYHHNTISHTCVKAK